MNALSAFLAHNWEWVFWALVCAGLNYLSRKKTSEEWEAWALRQPLLALGAELLRAVGIDPKKVPVALKRYAERRAGRVPEDLWDKAPVSPALRDVLRDPQKRARLETLLIEVREETHRPTVAPPAPSDPTPPAA